jgi:hypothetical protein
MLVLRPHENQQGTCARFATEEVPSTASLKMGRSEPKQQAGSHGGAAAVSLNLHGRFYSAQKTNPMASHQVGRPLTSTFAILLNGDCDFILTIINLDLTPADFDCWLVGRLFLKH